MDDFQIYQDRVFNGLLISTQEGLLKVFILVPPLFDPKMLFASGHTREYCESIKQRQINFQITSPKNYYELSFSSISLSRCTLYKYEDE